MFQLPNIPLVPSGLGNLNLGLGNLLGRQVQDETEEMRRRRLMQQRARSLLSPASLALFGGMGGEVSNG